MKKLLGSLTPRKRRPAPDSEGGAAVKGGGEFHEAVQVRVVEARGLKKMDALGSADPYVSLRLGGSIGDTLTQTTITLEAMAGGTALHGEPNSQEGFSRDNFFVLLLLYCSTVYYGCV